MPAVVDHDQRRRQVAEVAAGLVARGGAEAATVRAVAEAAGYSTKVVSHYFADKRALLLTTYRHAAEHSRAVAEASQAGGVPHAGAYCLALLPIIEGLRRDWMVWFAFWGLAITDPEFAAEQRLQVRRARQRIAELLAIDPRFSGLSPEACQGAARDLLTAVVGVALQAVFDPDDWPPDRQARAIEDRLSALASAA